MPELPCEIEQRDAVRRSVAERMVSEDVGPDESVRSGMRWRGCLVRCASMVSLVSALSSGWVCVVGSQAGVTFAKAMPVAYWRTNLASESVGSVARMAAVRTQWTAPQAQSSPPMQVDSTRRDS